MTELFTGNTLIVMGWVPWRMSAAELARKFVLVYLSNIAGAALSIP